MSDANSAGGHSEISGEEWEAESNKEEVVQPELSDINTTSLKEFNTSSEVETAIRECWSAFLEMQGSADAAAEFLYATIYEGIPSLQEFFISPRSIQGRRFMAAIAAFVGALREPALLMAQVETLAFAHLNLEMSVSRVSLFRDVILDMFEMELGLVFNEDARTGWSSMLNYIGGAIIYIKEHYATRLEILAVSWKHCTEKEEAETKTNKELVENKSGEATEPEETGKKQGTIGGQTVPTTFPEMFRFSATMMGFGEIPWMNEVLSRFDVIVNNISDATRLKEECDILVLRFAKVHSTGRVHLSEFKSCMLAALRSLLPKSWDTSHEVAWGWLWDQVERLMVGNLGKPRLWEKSLDNYTSCFDDMQLYELRRQIFERFFARQPNGGDFFKQSDTRLHFIMDRVIGLVSAIVKDPWTKCDEISAMGLRHVGYGVTTDLFGPFVTSAIEVVGEFTQDEELLHAFRWSLALISNMMVRTVREGSTIVMKSITTNSASMLRRAVAAASRRDRATWVLKVQVGSQSISPLLWAIDSGALDVSMAILHDLLTIRADRQRYYYGVDALFARHPDIINRLIQDAPTLLPELLNGLVWRSKSTKDSKRRVNYYIRHLVEDAEGKFSPTLQWLVLAKDPKIIAHPVIVLVSDNLWNGLVRREFSLSRIWFVFSLFVFVLSQSFLPRSAKADDEVMRVFIFIGRLINYALTMGRLMWTHARECYTAYRNNDLVKIGRFPIWPAYLKGYELASLTLGLLFVTLCVHEPMFWCLTSPGGTLLVSCPESANVVFRYKIFVMCAMIIHWVLCVDLAVFSTALSAFCLVVSQVLSEIGRFLVAFIFLLATFGTSVSVLEHSYTEMNDVFSAVVALFAITLQVYEDDYRQMIDDPALLAAVVIFILVTAILLLNLLVAQLGCSYEFIYQDSVGFARLRRAQIICETIEDCPEKKWVGFLDTLGLQHPIEFNEGDVGLSGGIQILEEASLHPVTSDGILRFGGSCAPETTWPEDDTVATEGQEERLERIEGLIQKFLNGNEDGGQSGSGQGKSGNRSGTGGASGEAQVSSGGGDAVGPIVPRTEPSSRKTTKGGKLSFTFDMDKESDGAGADEEVEALAASFAAAADSPFAEDQEPTSASISQFDSMNTASIDELSLDTQSIDATREAWSEFLKLNSSKEKAGTLFFRTLFEASPPLEGFFHSPMPIQATKFMDTIDACIGMLDKPVELKKKVEAIGLSHMAFEITQPRMEIFRDAFFDVMVLELNNRFSIAARSSFKSLFNYMGGAVLHTIKKYSGQLKILTESWEICAGTEEDREQVSHEEGESPQEDADNHRQEGVVVQTVPKTFKDMFRFNAVVMGFADIEWMEEVLRSFPDIAKNFGNSDRVKQECDLICLRISKKLEREHLSVKSVVKLADFKACMLAGLRSLLPKLWSTEHEVAWAWLWESVETSLTSTLFSPPIWEKALIQYFDQLQEENAYSLRKDVYAKVFDIAPSSQTYFKQSDTRLHFIADSVLKMSIAIFADPWEIADSISALGLRHVGFDVPTELFGPFVVAYTDVVGKVVSSQVTVEAFKWALTLISQMLMRSVQEGSTIVMKAINSNCVKGLRAALAHAPRGCRAAWCLIVQVGTQTISPLSWAVESGSFDAAEAIIEDLLTIRADREKYYYAAEELFERLPDIIKRIAADAPQLLPPLLDGLIWRSRNTDEGMRRVNYYVKYLVQTDTGGVSSTLDWIAGAKDPKIISHPVVVVVSDTLWSGVVSRQFIYSKIWFLLSLLVFMFSQALLPKLDLTGKNYIFMLIFICRINMTLFTMGRLFVVHLAAWIKAFKEGTTTRLFGRVPIPLYLTSWYETSGFTLLILFFLMCVHEPMLWCMGDPEWPTEECESSEPVVQNYSVFAFCAMGLHWGLCVDFAVFNTGLSAFVLVVAQVMNEIVQFIIALLFLLLTFGSAISVLDHGYDDMKDMLQTAVTLFAITVRLYEQDYRNLRHSPALLSTVFIFVTATVILLLNLLTAQLNCCYEFIYAASVGFARLNRAEVIVETLKACPEARWKVFLKGLKFDDPLEFNEGDIGLAGGLQVQEPAYLNPVTQDRIFRFGGTCAPESPWPEDTTTVVDDDADKLTRIEDMIQKAIRRAGRKAKKGYDAKKSVKYNTGAGFLDAANDSGDQDMDKFGDFAEQFSECGSDE